MDLSILFENSDFLVINKPAGLVVHGDGRTQEPSVVDWILVRYPTIEGVGEDMVFRHKDKEVAIKRPGIVHRLDRDTSGVLMIAKTTESFAFLKEQFKSRRVHKKYQALVYGHLSKDEGRITEKIGRDSKDFRKKMAGSHARGTLRDAETFYRVIDRYVDETQKDKQGKFEKYTLVECEPVSGRTHQIRVHLKWLNHPIVADSLYSGKRKETLGMDRMALHARRLEFKQMDGSDMSIEAPVPDDMKDCLNSLCIYDAGLY